jgi:hypothetical protein
MWYVDDITLHWLKVRHETGRTYFVPWEQDPALTALHVLAVIPADAAESPELTVRIPATEMSEWERDRIITSSLRDAALVNRWRRERRKLEKQGTLEPVPVPIHHKQ